MPTSVVYLIAGLALLLAAVLPPILTRFAVSAPMVLLVLGMAIGLAPLPDGLNLDPVDTRPVIQRVTEITVLVALMGVGLALDRPFSFRDRRSWRAWNATWRLLAIAMPITIAVIAVLGWWLGLSAAAALLLGAVLAPTDPVLAGDVQVSGPQVLDDEEDDIESVEEIDEEDEVRFSLTSEAGLNDGLAFPFVYAGIFLAVEGPPSEWIAGWVAWELVGKIVLGVAVGMLVGWGLAKVAFRAPKRALRLAEQGEPLLVLAALVTTYGLSEVVGGYGFLAVFACGMTLRAAERGHEYHATMHQVIENFERLLVLAILLLLGTAMTNGLLAPLDWRGVVVAFALVFVVRPLAGLVSLGGWRRGSTLPTDMTRAEALATAFFGVRGVGSLYYLAYGAGLYAFPEERWLWATVALAIALSVFLHGALATPVMRQLEARRDRSAA
ncbi:cation:proton antiporter [Intrasporangium calvum]|uniref:Cation:proton antiporter n=1 Tax=Intrasporangium calvum TaxID=53358 RepID=A0ABT5GH39_9MICO|nr:cation:proton antiporter [Intrasporangium calvum]MDC5697574.1 cation:proton antiporter [Intrasporangium calvum]